MSRIPIVFVSLLLSLGMLRSAQAQEGVRSGEARGQVVTLDERGLRIDGEYVPLVSGEVHYWRLNPLFWRQVLTTMKEAGLELVSTYVPWNFHELAPGRFDFRGETSPTRDLAAFLDLCGEMGLRVLIRPGPYINAEWIRGGLPEDAVGLDHLHPRFLQRAEPYIQAVGEIIAPRQASRGGPVILCQVENEIFFPRSGKSEYAFGSGKLELNYDGDFVLPNYVNWLQRRFATVDELNRIYRTRYEDFSDISPPNYRRDHLAASLNSLRFVSDEIVSYFRWLRDRFRQAGITVPLYTNTGMQIVFYDYEGVEKIIDSVGLDIYMQPELPGDEPFAAIWYNALFRARMKFPWSPEFQSGIWFSWADEFGYVSGEHMKHLTLLSLASGLRGLNYYMFVARDQWFCAPVDEVGRKNPQFAPMTAAIRIARQLEPDDRLARVGLLWHLAHNHKFLIDRYDDWVKIGRYWMDRQGPKELLPWWTTFKALVAADVDFEIARLPDTDLSKYDVVVYAGPDFIDQPSLTKLASYVEQGGKVLVATQLPRQNLDLAVPSAFEQLFERLESSAEVIRVAPGGVVDRLSALRVDNYVKADARGIFTTIFRSRSEEKRYHLFIVNNSGSEVATNVSVEPSLFGAADEWIVVDLETGTQRLETKQKVHRFSLSLPPRAGTVYRIEASPRSSR